MAVSGIPELNAKLKAMPEKVRAAGMIAAEKGAIEIVDMMKRLAPVDDGDLRDSIDWNWTTVGGKKSVPLPEGNDRIVIYAGDEKAWYARLVEFGSAPHTIKVKRKRTLSDGETFFGDEVQHPGTTAQPFFYPAYRTLRKRTKDRIARAMLQVLSPRKPRPKKPRAKKPK